MKYKPIKGVKGYEIYYSTEPKFKKSVKRKVTTKTTCKLGGIQKGKTYYVKVHAYKLDSAGKKVYGKYSSVKKIKVNK